MDPPVPDEEAAPASERTRQGRVFREPWEAQAFAMAVALHDRGLFTWSEWSAALGAEIARAASAPEADSGDEHYHHWVAALEAIVVAKGLAAPVELHGYRDALSRAAGRTPHGSPIHLEPTDFVDAHQGDVG